VVFIFFDKMSKVHKRSTKVRASAGFRRFFREYVRLNPDISKSSAMMVAAPIYSTLRPEEKENYRQKKKHQRDAEKASKAHAQQAQSDAEETEDCSNSNESNTEQDDDNDELMEEFYKNMLADEDKDELMEEFYKNMLADEEAYFSGRKPKPAERNRKRKYHTAFQRRAEMRLEALQNLLNDEDLEEDDQEDDDHELVDADLEDDGHEDIVVPYELTDDDSEEEVPIPEVTFIKKPPRCLALDNRVPIRVVGSLAEHLKVKVKNNSAKIL